MSTVVQAPVGTAPNGTSVSATWTQTTGSGSQLVAVVTNNNGRTVTPPAGWSFYSSDSGTTTCQWAMYTIANATSRSGSETFTWNLAGDLSVFLLEITAADLSTLTLVKNTATGGTPTAGPVTVSGSGLFLGAVAMDGGDVAPAAPGAPWTDVNGPRARVEYQSTTGGSSSISFGSTTGTWFTFVAGMSGSAATAGPAGSTLQYNMNRLAKTTGLDAQGAANVWAGTTGLDLVGALNKKAGTTGLELQGVLNKLAGTSGLGVDGASAAILG